MSTISSQCSRRGFIAAASALAIGSMGLMIELAARPSVAEAEDLSLMADNTSVLPQSSSVLLTNADVSNLSRYQLYIARNEIYARHGYIFAQQDLRDYFAQKIWYQPSIPADQFDDDTLLSYIEETNIGKILEYENGSAQKDSCVFPQSSSVLLDEDDLAGCSAVDLFFGRNEIYARHGYIFNTEYIADYFNQKTWYNPTTPADQFNESVLSYIEQTNIGFILAHENGDDPTSPNAYMFPESSIAYLGDAELSQATQFELYIGRNEIYARHGYIFNQDDLGYYFGQKTWYNPTTPSDQFTEAVFNDYEQANIANILAYENA
ncbi:MAG: YARHG domain-containing protein [Coriobacteriales bacterium]|nr:YARHG domain-containing protein [Coriobacteriales bacterium]